MLRCETETQAQTGAIGLLDFLWEIKTTAVFYVEWGFFFTQAFQTVKLISNNQHNIKGDRFGIVSL